jgi:MraZ protein
VFLGEFHHTIDDKGRLTFPAKFRDALADGLVIVKGFEQCLFVFSRLEWPKFERKIREKQMLKENARRLSRLFFAGASEETLDKNGRVVIPGKLREFAQLEKDAIIVGVSDRLEIWSKTHWERYVTEAEKTYEETAEELADLGL